jgi:hypothetical protein
MINNLTQLEIDTEDKEIEDANKEIEDDILWHFHQTFDTDILNRVCKDTGNNDGLEEVSNYLYAKLEYSETQIDDALLTLF